MLSPSCCRTVSPRIRPSRRMSSRSGRSFSGMSAARLGAGMLGPSWSGLRRPGPARMSAGYHGAGEGPRLEWLLTTRVRIVNRVGAQVPYMDPARKILRPEPRTDRDVSSRGRLKLRLSRQPPASAAIKSIVMGYPLPDPHTIGRRQIELCIRRHLERLVPAVDVPDHAVDPIDLRAVDVADQLVAHRVLASLVAPGLGVSEKEAPVAAEPVDHRCRIPAQRVVVGVQSHQDATEIGDIFAGGLVALHMYAGERGVGVVLGVQPARARVEPLGVFLGPPVGEGTSGVEFSAFIIEAMRH